MIHQHAHTLAVAKLYISCGIFPPFLTPHRHRHVGDKGCSSYTSYTGWESNFKIQHHHKLHTRHCCRPPFQQFCQYRGPAQTHQSYNLNILSSSSPAQDGVEAGQYVHNPEWDLTPFQLWKRKQAAKAGAAKVNNVLEISARN